MTRVAGIDCGTNSIRLIIADIDPQTGEFETLHQDMIINRLGQGVDKTGRLADEAVERTFDALDTYQAEIEKYGVTPEHVKYVGTSASRDAENRDVYIAGIKERLGVDPAVISGDEEAELSFAGALMGLDSSEKGPFLLTDLGGGSTELVLGNRAGVEADYSMNIGCVRITERCLKSDPPTEAEIKNGLSVIDEAIDTAEQHVDIREANAFIGVAGTITTVAARALNLKEYDPKKIHGAKISFEDMTQACDDFISMTRAQRAELPYVPAGRVDVIGAGALVLKRLMERIEKATKGNVSTIIISETDILQGIALSVGKIDK